MNEHTEAATERRAKRSGSGLTAACVVFACGLLVWVVAVPMVVWQQLVLHAPLTDEAGLTALAMVPYTALSGLGALLVRSVLGRSHLASRLIAGTYLVLLVLGVLAVIVVHSG